MKKYMITFVIVVVSLALQPSTGYVLLIPRGFLITHNDAPQSVGFLWTSDQLIADSYLTAHNKHNRQTSMTLVGFEPTIAAGERS
jgi:hypothetical protein